MAGRIFIAPARIESELFHIRTNMIAEIQILKAQNLPDDIADSLNRFVENPDPHIPKSLTVFPYSWQLSQIGNFFISSIPWNQNSRMILRFFIHLADANLPQYDKSSSLLKGVMQALYKKNSEINPSVTEDVLEEIRKHHQTLDDFMIEIIKSSSYGFDWSLSSNKNSQAPFKNMAMNLIYQSISKSAKITANLLTPQYDLLGVFSLYHRDITSEWCRNSVALKTYYVTNCWLQILSMSSAYDALCIDYCVAKMELEPEMAFPLLNYLHLNRGGKYLDLLLSAAERPKAAQSSRALEVLLKHRKAEVIDIMARAFATDRAGDYISGFEEAPYKQLFDLVVERWNERAEALLINFISIQNCNGLKRYLVKTLDSMGVTQHPALRKAIGSFMEKEKVNDQTEIWQIISDSHPEPFIEDFKILLVGKSKPQREIAASVLAKHLGESMLEPAHELLASKKSDARLGAVALIERIANPASAPLLSKALEEESADAVRAAIHQALKVLGVAQDPVSEALNSSEDFDLDAFLKRNAKGVKMPNCSWLKVGELPPLHCIGDGILPEQAISFLIAKQSKQKDISAAPDMLPILNHVDREKSAPFAAALVEGFLNSEQAASDRWALTLGGLLGDNRIIPMLLSRIQGWCENARHKLAEYAAQAISLLPGNEPLMVLDSLANRYRSKFKNIGSACSAAFAAAATARGITSDELGDMVVPTFGFDADRVRRFEWEGGSICAELGADFKLSWFDPDTEKSWKSLPATASEEIKTEVKTVTKLIRETLKAQTARLEMSFVRQRHWPVARWRELFENHPFLSSFGSGLIWGVYDPSGILLRTFRRYANGILADANGAVEDLQEIDATIAMVHPLELEQAVIVGWKAHLSRMKVKQPFPQVDRAIERMDPLHANRKSISITEGKKLSAGTFKSRAERLGWNRGSVVDAGGISSYYKLYPGAGVEVILPTDNFWVGIDPMDEVQLGAAYFAKSGTVERGSYIYDEPAPNDPRVLRFDQVPAIVWSETMADLKAITVTKS